MKSINTEYNGYFFRSRMEARWAVFFDALGLSYHYEHQDFNLKSGRYLPDFYLPTFHGGAFAEVKPKFEPEAIEKCRQLCELTKRDVLLLEDVPDFKCVRYFQWEPQFSMVQMEVGLICADQAAGEDRMFVQPGYENRDLTISKENIPMLGETFIEAVFASRAARFEFLGRRESRSLKICHALKDMEKQGIVKREQSNTSQHQFWEDIEAAAANALKKNEKSKYIF